MLSLMQNVQDVSLDNVAVLSRPQMGALIAQLETCEELARLNISHIWIEEEGRELQVQQLRSGQYDIEGLGYLDFFPPSRVVAVVKKKGSGMLAVARQQARVDGLRLDLLALV